MGVEIFKDGGSKVVNEYGFEQYLKDGWVLDPAELEDDNPLMELTKQELIQYVGDNDIDLYLNMQMNRDIMIALIKEAAK